MELNFSSSQQISKHVGQINQKFTMAAAGLLINFFLRRDRNCSNGWLYGSGAWPRDVITRLQHCGRGLILIAYYQTVNTNQLFSTSKIVRMEFDKLVDV